MGVASMMKVAAALKTFASGFGLPAYANGSVPDPVDLPYITFPIVEPEWNQKASFYMQIWHRTTSNTELLTKADEICGEIGTGLIINFEGGYLVIWPESPLVQLMVDGDFRSVYINLSINAYHVPGI